MSYQYRHKDVSSFFRHQHQIIIQKKHTANRIRIGWYRPCFIAQDIREDMDHIGIDTSRAAYNQFYIYILILDGYVPGNLITPIGSGMYGGFALHILRYIHIEVTILIGLENFSLSLFRLHPYRRSDAVATLVHHLAIYANQVRQRDIHLASFSRRKGRNLYGNLLVDAAIIQILHSDAEVCIGRNFVRIISIRFGYSRSQQLSDAQSYTWQNLAGIILYISINGALLFRIIQVDPGEMSHFSYIYISLQCGTSFFLPETSLLIEAPQRDAGWRILAHSGWYREGKLCLVALLELQLVAIFGIHVQVGHSVGNQLGAGVVGAHSGEIATRHHLRESLIVRIQIHHLRLHLSGIADSGAIHLVSILRHINLHFASLQGLVG